ncbi:MAG: prolyl oligopeptidase family serine peptidase, partial [Pseudomonadota bacterium]
RRREAATDERDRVRAAHNSPRTLYLGKKFAGVGQSLSPSGKYAVLVVKPAKAKAGKSGSMPNYVTEDGYTSIAKTRTRVGKNPPAGQSIRLVNVETGAISAIDLSELPGIASDPLAELRKSALEWHVANGADKSSVEKALKPADQREVIVNSLRWSPDGSQIALQLFSVDNKDRWLVSIDAASGELRTQHRLSDPAWINYHNNEFGWLDDKSLWYLSEESGYSHLYSTKLNSRKHRTLTRGQHVDSDPQLNAAADTLYFRSNSTHPSTFEIFSVAVKGGQPKQLSTLGGVNHFVLSPDDSKLLISHTEFDRHADLFVKNVNSPSPAQRLTDTVSAEFKAIDWVIPEIVEVPSSHVEQPIYSKTYLPKDYDSARRYPAVMFVHGAGYTQNAHAGWPYYFREFMFHTLLTQKGYVVIDMDYRASKGYGRDWRTAIYRQMGHPELEDFQDGVKYLTEQYNVDPKRIGIYGGSYGGFMTFMAMFRDPDLFAAGAALRPVVDWMHYNHGYTSNILNTPQIDPVAYQKSSPINFVEGLKNPLLIAVGMQDDNVFFQDSVLMVQRLIELEKQDFEMAVYPLDPHGFVHPSAWLDEYRRILKLFERHLQ